MRSLLTIAADRGDLIEQAHGCNADVVVIDLEAVPDDGLEQARVHTVNAIASLTANEQIVFVRVHRMDSAQIAPDLAAVVVVGLGGIVLTHTRDPRDVRQFDIFMRENETRNQVRPGTAVLLPEISTARALLRAQEISQASSRIAGLVLDLAGYTRDIGVELSSEGRELDYARQVIVNVCTAERQQPLESAASGAGGTPEVARRLGMRGKYAPDLVEVTALNSLFTVDD